MEHTTINSHRFYPNGDFEAARNVIADDVNATNVNATTVDATDGDFSGTLTIQNSTVNGWIQIDDAQGHEHRFEANTEGITLRSQTNPAAGEPLFTIESSGNSERFRVEHDGSITSSNGNLWLGTDSNGAIGGRRVPKIRDIHYFDTPPTVTASQFVEE